MRYTTRPLSDRSWLNPSGRKPTRFSASWSDTLQLLDFEVTALRGRDLVIEVDLAESDLRLDGTIRARARASSPGAVVAFESKHGSLLYRCDRFTAQYSNQPDDWQQNVRAIALTLQALRAVDRYGATETGQQYTGWAAIGSTPFVAGPGPGMTREAAWHALCDLAGDAVRYGDDEDRVIRHARRRAHPDTGGSTEAWLQFEAALKVVRP